jgi:hypothetical protein
MAHRQHSSWNARAAKPKKVTDWARHYDDVKREATQALAEGQFRPAPGLEPPSREDTWIQDRVAAQEAREEADRQARQEAQEGQQ